MPPHCAAATLHSLAGLRRDNWATNESRAGCWELPSALGTERARSGDGRLQLQHLRRVPLNISLCIQGDFRPIKSSL